MNRGYALLEILIVVTIITVLIAGVGFSSGKSNQQRKFDQDVVSVVDVLTQAKERTIARDITNQTCPTFTGYTVWISPGTANFRMSLGCTTSVPIQSYVLQHAIILGTGPEYPINFLYPYATLSAARTLTVRSTVSAQCKQITISPTGVITQGDAYSC